MVGLPNGSMSLSTNGFCWHGCGFVIQWRFTIGMFYTTTMSLIKGWLGFGFCNGSWTNGLVANYMFPSDFGLGGSNTIWGFRM
jgi:hypothetical protein